MKKQQPLLWTSLYLMLTWTTMVSSEEAFQSIRSNNGGMKDVLQQMYGYGNGKTTSESQNSNSSSTGLRENFKTENRPADLLSIPKSSTSENIPSSGLPKDSSAKLLSTPSQMQTPKSENQPPTVKTLSTPVKNSGTTSNVVPTVKQLSVPTLAPTVSSNSGGGAADPIKNAAVLAENMNSKSRDTTNQALKAAQNHHNSASNARKKANEGIRLSNRGKKLAENLASTTEAAKKREQPNTLTHIQLASRSKKINDDYLQGVAQAQTVAQDSSKKFSAAQDNRNLLRLALEAAEKAQQSLANARNSKGEQQRRMNEALQKSNLYPKALQDAVKLTQAGENVFQISDQLAKELQRAVQRAHQAAQQYVDAEGSTVAVAKKVAQVMDEAKKTAKAQVQAAQLASTTAGKTGVELEKSRQAAQAALQAANNMAKAATGLQNLANDAEKQATNYAKSQQQAAQKVFQDLKPKKTESPAAASLLSIPQIGKSEFLPMSEGIDNNNEEKRSFRSV